MERPSFLRRFSKKLLLVVVLLLGLGGVGYFLWEKNKLRIIEGRLKSELLSYTDSLYRVTFDSIYINEMRGEAYLTNIRIIPDTVRVKSLPVEKQPYALLDISVSSLAIKGVNTREILRGTRITGDTIIISNPTVNLYLLKRVKKETRIEREATAIYKQILGKMDLIHFDRVFINGVNLNAYELATGKKNFQFNRAVLDLVDVKIDSAQDQDPKRTLFCREANFNLAEFFTYNNGRPEFLVKNLQFSGSRKTLAVEKFSVTRYTSPSGTGELLAQVDNFRCAGVHTNEFVKQKHVGIDSITAKSVLFYRQAGFGATLKGGSSTGRQRREGGFAHAYSLAVKQLYFPNISIQESGSVQNRKNLEIGRSSLKIRDVETDEIAKLKHEPFSSSKEIQLKLAHLSLQNSDKTYSMNFNDIDFNSLNRTLLIGKFTMVPNLSEAAFANRAGVQKDRYDLSLRGVALRQVNLDQLLQDELIADALMVNGATIKIYRDLNFPVSPVSKVGTYPHQRLMKADMPINIRSGMLNNTTIEYGEKNPASDKSGRITFNNSTLSWNNLSNIPDVINQNRFFTVSLQTHVLGKLPLQTTINFDMLGKKGEFNVTGKAGSCNAKHLNVIARPMAMMEIDTGFINSMSFNFRGNDFETNGDFEFRYKGVKVKLLKKDDESNKLKRRSLMSFVANAIIKNDNPDDDGELRSYIVQYTRDPHKSFFNLLWKSIFVGIQETMGFPKSKERNVRRKV
jgi:hypothetical protein